MFIHISLDSAEPQKVQLKKKSRDPFLHHKGHSVFDASHTSNKLALFGWCAHYHVSHLDFLVGILGREELEVLVNETNPTPRLFKHMTTGPAGRCFCHSATAAAFHKVYDKFNHLHIPYKTMQLTPAFIGCS